MNWLLGYCGAQIGYLALSVLYVGTPSDQTHISMLIKNAILGENWDVVGQTQDPRWPSFYWALIYVTFWTLLMGLPTAGQSFSR